MSLLCKSILILGLIFISFGLYSQVINPEKPKQAEIKIENVVVVKPIQSVTTPQINLTNPFNIPDPSSNYVNDIMNEVEQHQKKLNAELNNDLEYSFAAIRYNLPINNSTGTEYYRRAFKQLEIINTTNQSLKDAVYVVENAFFENKLDYDKFSGTIQEMANLCNIKIQDENESPDNDLTKNLMLFNFMSDTIEFYDAGSEQNVYTYPMKYDFEDYEGKLDYRKMFVTKLLMAKTGQCHSMPLLYMIIAQEIGSEAYLSYSPSHSFVKIRDNNNQWYNLELTNGVIISDAAITESGFVKAEAVKNKIYLDTLGTNKVLAQCYVDLASGYKFKYGYDEFVLSCINKSLEIFPNNIIALQMKADFLTLQSAYVAKQYGHDINKLRNDSIAVDLFNYRNAMYKMIDEIGYELMPPAKYEAWLRSLNQEKVKTEHTKQYMKLNQLKGL